MTSCLMDIWLEYDDENLYDDESEWKLMMDMMKAIMFSDEFKRAGDGIGIQLKNFYLSIFISIIS